MAKTRKAKNKKQGLERARTQTYDEFKSFHGSGSAEEGEVPHPASGASHAAQSNASQRPAQGGGLNPIPGVRLATERGPC
jgi:hypothetical protein